jgi:beta-glucanase (GH16 family)
MVRSGEIDSLRRDMRYGSFRVGMKMSDVPGTCAAFFWVSCKEVQESGEYATDAKHSIVTIRKRSIWST